MDKRKCADETPPPTKKKKKKKAIGHCAVGNIKSTAYPWRPSNGVGSNLGFY